MSDTEYPVRTEANPDQNAVDTLYYFAIGGIAVWALGILAILISAFRFPAVF